jgi:hypothetical protein
MEESQYRTVERGPSSRTGLKVILEESSSVAPYTPGHLEECQNKEFVEGAICKCMKRKNANSRRKRKALSFRMGIVGIHPAVFV